MSVSTTVQIHNKGALTLPVGLRRKYNLDEGDLLTLIDLGDGSFLLTPVLLQVDRLGDKVAQAIAEAGTSVDEILETLDEERERYYQDRYASD